jgi:hypothetical protein
MLRRRRMLRHLLLQPLKLTHQPPKSDQAADVWAGRFELLTAQVLPWD